MPSSRNGWKWLGEALRLAALAQTTSWFGAYTHVTVAPTPGTRLGVYEVTSLIGEGGMGQVYRARDTKLNRDVALKVLPDSFASDPDRLARFTREAQTLASLNHPNIAHIHGLEESGGVRALVMELVEGEDLSQRIARGAIPLDEALPIAKQIADALEAAHEQGIIHRDLKPANIKVRADGTVKVLDFGLAKALDQSLASSLQSPFNFTASPTLTSPAFTRAGVILGTAAYMSPEQARGKAVDKRVDVWSFGAVLYEMLTGRTVFAGGTTSDTIVAVLEREPQWDRLPETTPPTIRRLLRRCLEKDPKRRLRDIADVRIEIDDAATASPDPPQTRRALATARERVVLALLAATVVASAVAWYVRGAAPRFDRPLANAQFSRLTDFAEDESDAAISPDGKFVSFLSDHGGRFDLWVGQLGTGRFANLTNGRFQYLTALIPVAGFTADGSELWLHEGDTKQPLMLIPTMGGPPRVWLSKSPAKLPPMNAAWSPDGSRLAYHTADDGDPMFVADRSGANARQIFTDRAGIHNHFPIWSPDGRWIYFVHGSPIAGDQDVWRIAADGGAPQQLTNHHSLVGYPTPIDQHRVLYVAPDRDGSGPWLWAVDVDRRTTERVSFGLEQYISVAASADGRRLVATVANPTASLWTVPILDHVAEEPDVRSFPVPTVRALAPRFAESTLVYLSSRGTGDGLWRFERGEAVEIWKGSDGALHEPAAISHDGNRIAVVLRQNGAPRLLLLAGGGGDPQPVAQALDVRGTPAWSPDGRWIAVGAIDGQGEGLFKVAASGGALLRLTTGAAMNPVWSPDGMLIAYEGADVGAYATVRAVRPDGSPITLPTINVRRGGQRVRFVPDGRGLVYMTGLQSAQDFWMLDLRTMKTRQLTRLNDTANMQTFDVTPDGRQIVFDRLRANSDIVLIQLPK
jgi:serine/threonine protein kinase/Tol biopolymer transport system component